MLTRNVVGLLLNYRDAGRSVRCIHSLLNERLDHVVVWDNSEDDRASASAVRSVMSDDARLDLQISCSNLGFAAGVNRALAHCARVYPGAWVLLINNDAHLLPGAMLRLVRGLEANPGAKIAFPNIDHAGRVLGPAYCHRLTGLLSWRPRRGFFSYASGCCMLIATDRITLPLFDEDFFMYGEDWELGWRLGRQPGATVHVDATLVEHDGAASSGLGSPFYEAHMVAAHLMLAHKLADSRLDAYLLHGLRVSMLIARAAVRAIRFRSFVPCRALWEGARIAFRKHHGYRPGK